MNPTTPAPVYSVRSISYPVPSATSPGVVYTVSQELSGKLRCECKAAQVGRYACWHVKTVKAGMVKPHVRLTVAAVEHPVDLLY
ncbi:MAG: SWIM zinc finger family protein [Dehalococcoidia bacterium]